MAAIGEKSEAGRVDEGITTIDTMLNGFMTSNFHRLVQANTDDDEAPWREATRQLLSYVSSLNLDREEIAELRSYAVDRVVARMSNFPYFTDEMSVEFFRETGRLPEGPAWAEHIQRHPEYKRRVELMLDSV